MSNNDERDRRGQAERGTTNARKPSAKNPHTSFALRASCPT